jgi:hypothetical protein
VAERKPPQRRNPPKASPARTKALEAETAEPITDVIEDAERRAQAAFAGIEVPDEVTFIDRRFRIAAKVPMMPLLQFANAAAQGTETGDMEGMAAMYNLLRSCIYAGHAPCGTCEACIRHSEPGAASTRPDLCPAFDRGDWDEFTRYATETGAGAEELFDVVSQTLTQVMARPTSQGSGSPRSGSATGQNSTGRSPSPAAGLVAVADLVS